MSIFPPYSSKVWKILGLIVAGLFLIGLVLFGLDRCGGYWASKKADKLKANVNAALDAIKAAEANKQAGDVDIAVKVEQLKQATTEALEAANTTDEAKAATNAALANLANAVNANRPVGTTATDLERQLNNLGIE